MLGAEVKIKQDYVASGQVKLILVPMLDHGDRSIQAHQAVECAGEQGHYWALHDRFFEELGDLWGRNIREVIKTKAAAFSIDHTAFNRCIDEQRYVDLVKEQDQWRREQGIRSRPTIFVNDQIIVGPQPYQIFQQAIEMMLRIEN